MEYSAQRIESLSYEWYNHYPNLISYLSILERMPSKFKLSAITKEKIDQFALSNAMDGEYSPDPVVRAAYAYINGGSPHAFVIALTKVLYCVGILGIKLDGFSAQIWSFQDVRPPSDGQIKPSSTVFVHPMVWARLGIVIDS